MQHNEESDDKRIKLRFDRRHEARKEDDREGELGFATVAVPYITMPCQPAMHDACQNTTIECADKYNALI